MSKSYHKPRKPQLRTGRKRLLLWGALALLVFCVGLVVGYYRERPTPRAVPVAAAPEAPPSRDVILYFASADGTSLVAENRAIPECGEDDECLRRTIEALLDGPQGGLVPVLPPQTELRGVAVEGSLVNVDFSRELVTAHPGGTQSELLTVYGLVDTLAVNFPHLRQVRLLVEGAPAMTLKGHVDLRQPVTPEFSLVKESPAAPGSMLDLPAGREE